MKFVYDVDKTDLVFAGSFKLNVEVYRNILKAVNGLEKAEQSRFVERLFEASIKKASAFTSKDTFFFVSDRNTTTVCSMMQIAPNNWLVVYNNDWFDSMRQANAQSFINYAIRLAKLQKSGELKPLDPRNGIYQYKGKEVTYRIVENINTPLTDVSPWRKDLLFIQCKELGIQTTNDMQVLSGLEKHSFNELYDRLVRRQQVVMDTKIKLRAAAQS